MNWRTAASVLATLTIGALVTGAWLMLREHEYQHHADILEGESYATRSHLARELAVQFEALRAVARFWADYGHLPAAQWGDDARIELQHFHGFETILWTDPENQVRYVATADDGLTLDRIPDDAQWQALAPMLEGFGDGEGPAVAGPDRDAAGTTTYRVRIPARSPSAGGVLVARIDARTQLDQLLVDRSPGQSISVSWDDVELYRRNEAAAELPEDWVRSGMIELPMGGLWTVRHTPTAELASALGRPTLPGLLIAGWTIALLVGGLLHQIGRVRVRAAAAEAAEVRYAQLNAELEARVVERTEELAERNADLETIHQSVGHDIRSPLSTIDLSASLVRQLVGNPDAVKAVERIERANKQIAEVMERLNAYSTVAFVSLDRERVNMQSMAEDVLRQLRQSLSTPAANVEVRVGTLPPCLAQPVLVEILWYNLLSNAIKYSAGCASPQVEVGANADIRPAVFWVRDNGIGFEATQNEEVFKPFARLDPSREGQGLGLAIAARVVKRHGGRIWAESAPGAGATFCFELGPASTVDQPAAVGDPTHEADASSQNQATA